jgi:hypothetical protein
LRGSAQKVSKSAANIRSHRIGKPCRPRHILPIAGSADPADLPAPDPALMRTGPCGRAERAGGGGLACTVLLFR